MLSIVIRADSGGERLANTLAALVPAVAEGLVKEGWILETGDDPDIRMIADAAGCECLRGEHALTDAVRGASGEWVMFLLAGVAPEEGWWREVASFTKHRGAAVQSSAAFSLADPRSEWGGRLAEWGAKFTHAVTGRANDWQGLIVPRLWMLENETALDAGHFPPRLPGRTALLRTRAVSPSSAF